MSAKKGMILQVRSMFDNPDNYESKKEMSPVKPVGSYPRRVSQPSQLHQYIAMVQLASYQIIFPIQLCSQDETCKTRRFYSNFTIPQWFFNTDTFESSKPIILGLSLRSLQFSHSF